MSSFADQGRCNRRSELSWRMTAEQALGVSANAAVSPLVDFVAGTAGGVASLLAGHPFDTIKTRLQAQPSSRIAVGGGVSEPLLASVGHGSAAVARPVHYASAYDALRRIVAEERISGLYKGVTSPMLGVAAMNASIFGVYGLTLRTLDAGRASESHASPLFNIFLAGCASGLVSAFITSPIDLIKIRQQLSLNATSLEPSTLSVVRDIWRRGGLRGVYRGLGCTCIRDLGYGPYFLTYEVLNRFLLTLHPVGAYGETDNKLSNIEMAISGGLAGVVAWLSTFGVDVVKTRVQAVDRDPLSSEDGRRRSAFIQAARSTYRQGGWRAFFAGVGPTVLRALPVNAALFITFETTKDFLVQLGM